MNNCFFTGCSDYLIDYIYLVKNLVNFVYLNVVHKTCWNMVIAICYYSSLVGVVFLNCYYFESFSVVNFDLFSCIGNKIYLDLYVWFDWSGWFCLHSALLRLYLRQKLHHFWMKVVLKNLGFCIYLYVCMYYMYIIVGVQRTCFLYQSFYSNSELLFSSVWDSANLITWNTLWLFASFRVKHFWKLLREAFPIWFMFYE